MTDQSRAERLSKLIGSVPLAGNAATKAIAAELGTPAVVAALATLDALEALLSGYQSHGFVIDRTEAENLFKNVKPICEEMVGVIAALGPEAVLPRNRRRGQTPRLEYLHDEPQEPPASDQPSPDKRPPEGHGPRPGDRGNGAGELPGNPEAGAGPEAGAHRMTPAQAAGVDSRLWEIDDIVKVVEAWEADQEKLAA